MGKSSQQKWNENNPEIIKKATQEFYHRNKQIKIIVNKDEHSDLIDWYEQLDKDRKKKLRSKIESEVIDFMYRQKNQTLNLN